MTHWKILKTFSGSCPISFLSHYTTFSQTQTGTCHSFEETFVLFVLFEHVSMLSRQCFGSRFSIIYIKCTSWCRINEYARVLPKWPIVSPCRIAVRNLFYFTVVTVLQSCFEGGRIRVGSAFSFSLDPDMLENLVRIWICVKRIGIQNTVRSIFLSMFACSSQ